MLEVFITGIKPDSGVTFITGGLAATMQSLGYSTAVYLPAQTGAQLKDGYIQAPDLLFAKFMDKNIMTFCSYLYKNERLSLKVFEEEKLFMDRNIIFQDYMSVAQKYECLLVNGHSNMETPIEKNFNEEELIYAMNIPLILVASLADTTLEEILDYLNVIQSRALQLRGIIINECPFRSLDYDVREIQKIIEKRTGVSVLGIIPKLSSLHGMKPEDWIEYILGCTDIEAIFNIKIAKLSS